LKELESEVLSYMRKRETEAEEISLSPRVKRVFEYAQKKMQMI